MAILRRLSGARWWARVLVGLLSLLLIVGSGLALFAATTTPSTAHPATAFAATVRGFGFPAALLLDKAGRALAVAPPAPSLIGTEAGAKYSHLAAALNGHLMTHAR